MRTLFYFLVAVLLCNSSVLRAQQADFPAGWTGNWKGELCWWMGADSLPKKVKMELRIQPADTAGQFHWHLIYGEESGDSRPYLLKPVDISKGHWRIDEGNGIILDQFWVGNRLTGAFTVLNATIINTYQLDGDTLQVEFHNLSGKPIATTGKGDENIPFVDSYRVRSYQRASLLRQ